MSPEGLGEARNLRHRVFRFGQFTFNEGTQELLAEGSRRALESKSRLLLRALLAQPRMVVSKKDLKQAVWPEKQFVEEGSLATAIYSLRLGLEDKDHQIVGVVPGVGYRMLVPVEVSLVEARADEAPLLIAGAPVPGRASWILDRSLSMPPASEVWLAHYEKTLELRVFKFADTAERLDALKREAAISRVLLTRLGEREDIVPVLEWNFEDRPYFIESPHGGADLQAWLNGPGALKALNAASRVALVAMAARTVGDAHGAGVLHGDIKPANMLVAEHGNRPPQIRLIDFGGGGLTETARAEALTLSMQALGERGAGTRTGSLLYMAPELQRGGDPTAAGDVYALGILLYQMVVGDLERPLAAGWEDDVTDDILRSDIAAAAAGDPARRIPSAAVLADRLQNLPARREELAREREDTARTQRLAEAARRARLRRPWMVLAAAALVLGLVATGFAELRALRERDEALRQARIAQAVNLFLTDDLLGRGNPVVSGKRNETLMEAVSNAEPRIAFRLAREPVVAASIYYSLAQAFASRGAFDEARTAYDSATAAFLRAQGPNSPDVTIVELRRAEMEAKASDAGSLERARKLIAAAAKNIDGVGRRSAEARVWLLAAQGTLQLVGGGDVGRSREQFKEAGDLADAMPDTFDLETRLMLRQRQAFAEFRLGHWDPAQTLFTDVLTRQLALHGPLHPDSLLVKLNLAQVLMARGAAAAAVESLNDDFIRQLTAVFGPGNHAVLTALAARGRSLMTLGRYDDALRDNAEVYRAAAVEQGANSQFAILALADIAEAQCRQGHTGDGIGSASRAYDAARKSFPNMPTIAQDVATDLASCFLVARRYAEAAPLLKGIDAKAVAEFEADPDRDAEVDLMLADVAANEGDMARARALLAKPARVFGAADADPFFRRRLDRLKTTLEPDRSPNALDK